MPTTFKAAVYKDNLKQDGTRNVKIRVTHRRATLKVSTNIYVASHQMTRGLKLKDQYVIDETDRIIRNWRRIVSTLGAEAEVMTVKQIVDHIKHTEQEKQVFRLDFIAYGRKLAAPMKPGTGNNYRVALNALVRHIKAETLDISEVNANFLTGFEKFIENEPALSVSKTGKVYKQSRTKSGGRAVSSYLACLRHIHNQAKAEFNDEDCGIIRIPQSPFKKYHVKQPPKPKKRAIGLDVLQKIINLDNENRRDGSVADFTRRDLARDCFMLSFGLAGMNAADLLACPAQPLKDNIIVYNRQKTASRRSDGAEMHIRIEPEIIPLVKKYKDPSGARLFCFHRHYRDNGTFNSALNQGLKRIDAVFLQQETKRRKEQESENDSPIQVEHITFYAARHTWATSGRSSALDIDKYTIHEGLNHVDADMKITDRYIDRDWSVIWEANAKIIGLLNWSAMKEREERSEQ